MGQQRVALFLQGALISRVSWKQFSGVQIWMQSREELEQ